jgi:tryptophan synthase alpha chain
VTATRAANTSPSTTSRSRIAGVFAACAEEGRAALMPFLTAGYPNLESSATLLDALVEGGADLIEIGVPFSDPLADGATVQHASQVALDKGTTLRHCFELARAFRARGFDTPLIFMGYTNPFFQYGPERLAAEAANAGVDGFIIPDLPMEESKEFAEPLRAHGRDLIFLVAPTSTDARIQEAARWATGFIYCVSLIGVTGARESLATGLADYIRRVRSFTDLPLALGFGISTPEHVRQAAGLVDGVIVASALIDHIERAPAEAQATAARDFVRSLREATGKQGAEAPGEA